MKIQERLEAERAELENSYGHGVFHDGLVRQRIEKIADELKRIEASRPRPYDLGNPDELLRLHRECHGYLRTCHSKHGTDWEGRQFAIDALEELAKFPKRNNIKFEDTK